MTSQTPEEIPCIMIVDDEPENLHVLSGMLQREGWQVSCFPLGKLALDAARKKPPDLILMDICMPEWDGYETCRHFKNEELLRDIPLLFLSALSEPNDKLRAFQEGGADYITKPFYYEEVT
jgi:CheY-like chemotaxis protein